MPLRASRQACARAEAAYASVVKYFVFIAVR
jgi:hypothetical protein